MFQLASVSKPISSTLAALQVGRGDLSWSAPVVEVDPRYPLANLGVTVESLLAHRSGLPGTAGDVLEDTGYTRDEILRRLKLAPLVPVLSGYRHFCSTYAYSNFGYTLGAQAASRVKSDSWEAAARRELKTLDMHNTVVTNIEYRNRPNRAVLHRRTPPPLAGKPPFPTNPTWFESARYPDAQAPAGGIASTLNDLIPWMTLHIAAHLAPGPGFPDTPFLVALRRSHEAYVPGADYGLGWNVGTTNDGSLRLGHSGGFLMGAATTVSLVPSAKIGIVTLTNGEPIGIPEALCEAFLVELGLVTPKLPGPYTFENLLTEVAKYFERLLYPLPEIPFSPPPTSPRPAQPLPNYAGTYAHPYFGPITITPGASALTMTCGPSGTSTTTPLDHWDGDVFTYIPPGENGGQRSGVRFDTKSTPATLHNEHLFEPYSIGQLDDPPLESALVDSWLGFYALDTRLRAPAPGVLRSVSFGARTDSMVQIIVYRQIDGKFLPQGRSPLLKVVAGKINHFFLDTLPDGTDAIEVETGDFVGFYQPSPGPIGYGFPGSVSHETRHDLTLPLIFTAQNSPSPNAFEYSSERVYLFEFEVAWGLRGAGCATRTSHG